MPAAARRLFRVHFRHVDRHRAHTLDAASFEAAAVACLESWQATSDDSKGAVVIVRELSSGIEHCFRVDLESGIPGPGE